MCVATITARPPSASRRNISIKPPFEHRVEAAGGLVEQEHRRVPDQLQSARGPPPLTAGEVPDPGAAARLEIKFLEHPLDGLLRLRARPRAVAPPRS